MSRTMCEKYNFILADSDQELAKFTIQGRNVVREFNVVYLKHADIQDKSRLFLLEPEHAVDAVSH